jgi:trehalose 6-phosphate synthase
MTTNGLVVAANRAPGTIRRLEDGSYSIGHGAGGLSPSLARALEGRGARWVAAALSDAERMVAGGSILSDSGMDIDLDFVDLPPEVVTAAYNVIANTTLWFLHHGMFDRVRRPLFDRHWHDAWRSYVAYNNAFAERIGSAAAPGATVVVNDYHLSLVGSHLARIRPDLNTVHFTHTPFATPEELSVLPSEVARALIQGLCSFGAVGFHTALWRDRFLASASEWSSTLPVAFVAALGSDADQLRKSAAAPEVVEAREALRARTAGRRLIVRSDRIEPSKNIVRGVLAFAELLDSSPELVSEVRLVMRLYASRTGLADYLAYAAEIDRVTERVNERFAKATGEPVIELDRGDNFAASLAALSIYDVLLVNPIRDGMNLVAKEGPLVNTTAGALALSDQAGAFAELGPYSVRIEPFDVSGTAAALASALALDPTSRAARSVKLAEAASLLPPAEWLDEVIRHAGLATEAR